MPGGLGGEGEINAPPRRTEKGGVEGLRRAGMKNASDITRIGPDLSRGELSKDF